MWFRQMLIDYAREIKRMCMAYGGMIDACDGCPFRVEKECALKANIPALWKTGKIES